MFFDYTNGRSIDVVTGGENVGLARLTGQAIHTAVPGRARIRIHGLRHDPTLARWIEQALLATAGVSAAQANHHSGNLLVQYQPDLPLASLLATAGITLDHPASPKPAPKARPTRQAAPARSVSSALHQWIGHRKPAPTPAAARASRHAWHAMPLETVLKELDAGQTGLDHNQVETRLRRFGPNLLPEAERRSELAMLAGQFASLPVLLLGASAVISVATGGAADAVVILGVVLINAGIGFFTERQSERTINALLQGPALNAKVLRDGVVRTIPAGELVPGDVIVIEPGTQIPADARLFTADQLSVDESALTGESLPVAKSPSATCLADTALGDRIVMLYKGTLATGGSGQAMVVATGSATEIGLIQQLASEAHAPDTPMQRQLDQLSTQLALISGAVCAGVFGFGLLRGYGLLPMLKSSVSLAVAAVPEGLPTVATTTLALGIREMSKRNVAIRKLAAVETLGSVQTFCMDKTGTLTENRMRVVSVVDGLTRHRVARGRFEDLEDGGESERLRRLLEVIVLCNDTQLNGEGEPPSLDGSPTEIALVELALLRGVDVAALRRTLPRLDVHYRAEARPWMTTVHARPEGRRLVAVKGSPAEVLAMCGSILRDDGLHPLDDETRVQVLAHNEAMAGEALRVLGVACADIGEGEDENNAALTWLGMVGMADPLREGIPDLIKRFHAAGVETVMITGDQSATAYAIGRELGLANGGPLQILDASSLEKVDENLLAALVRKVHVFARVSPKHKLRIVQALQRSGRVVAMTGDGINDGPALKAADIGVAMGGSGTDVARSMADVVLEDDNLHTMTTAISQGRTIYANIRKSVHFLLATNFSEIELMLAGIALGMGQPLTPIQLLWINLATDIFPALALAMERAEPDVMDLPPRDPREQIITRGDLGRISLESAMITAGTFGSYLLALGKLGAPQAGTVAFTSLTLAQLLHATSCRSERHGLFSRGRLPSNPWLNTALLGSAAIQLALPYLPPTRALFGLSPLGPAGLALSLAGAAAPLLVNEAIKELRRRQSNQHKSHPEERPS